MLKEALLPMPGNGCLTNSYLRNVPLWDTIGE
jgi:hypothetical protein